MIHPDFNETRELRVLARSVVRRAWRRGRASERFHGYQLQADRVGKRVLLTLQHDHELIGTTKVDVDAHA